MFGNKYFGEAYFGDSYFGPDKLKGGHAKYPKADDILELPLPSDDIPEAIKIVKAPELPKIEELTEVFTRNVDNINLDYIDERIESKLSDFESDDIALIMAIYEATY